MRLIDADALIEDCRKYINTLNPDNDWDWKEIAKMRWLIGVTMNLPTIEPQPEIVRCKDCKWCENADGLMCKNPASWVVATDRDFGCVLAERKGERND